jgi:hypothetical protein
MCDVLATAEPVRGRGGLGTSDSASDPPLVQCYLGVAQRHLGGAQWHLSGTQQQLSGMQRRLSGMQRQLSGMQRQLSGMQRRLSGMQRRLSGTQQQLSGTQRRLSGMQRRLSGMQWRLSGMQWRLSGTQQQLSGMQRRLSVAQRRARWQRCRRSRQRPRPGGLKLVQNFGLVDAVSSCDRSENGIQRSDPQRLVLWNSDAVMSRLFRLQEDVAAFLINSAVAVVFAQQFDQFRTAQVARQLHQQTSTSSRTR